MIYLTGFSNVARVERASRIHGGRVYLGGDYFIQVSSPSGALEVPVDEETFENARAAFKEGVGRVSVQMLFSPEKEQNS